MIMNKRSALAKINSEISNCARCHKGTTGLPVPGEGNPNADIVFIGEAPGKEEAKSGRPFIGRSGKLLRGLIKDAGLKEKDVFITSPVKYLPKRGTPTKEDIKHGFTHLDKQLEIINPKAIVLLGKTAAYAFFQKSFPILKDHGRIITKDNKKYFLTLHPAAVVRFPKYKKLISEDFNKLKELI